MVKKRYNEKGRKVEKVTVLQPSDLDKIVVDIEHKKEQYDDSNAFILPNKKRKTKKEKDITCKKKFLSKKRRKELEKIVERKNNKAKKAELFEALDKVKASNEELKQYISLKDLQTKGLKRYLRELKHPSEAQQLNSYNQFRENDSEDETNEQQMLNALKGSKKMRLQLLNEEEQKTGKAVFIRDPNVIDLNESSEYYSESSESHNEHVDHVEESDKLNKGNENNVITEKSLQFSQRNISNKIVEKAENECVKSISSQKRDIQISNAKGNLKELTDKKLATFVIVDRKSEVQKSRMKLPILAEEQSIVEAINENPVVIITGETGSGKTTQVPQFLYEAGYASKRLIGITEPRRVAAISMSTRVAEEMNLSEKEVSYLIRFEGNVSEDTKIKFMTDGVLLKEIQHDFLLKNYSVIILDEAHERSVYTDILIGLLTRIVNLRTKKNDPLKLIIMSATLRVKDFIDNPKLFKVKPPVINVESRQFPVTIHFNKKTSQDYVKDALRKVIRVHTQLPDGGILVFLTGQREVNYVVRKLRKLFPFREKKVKGPKVNEKEIKVETSEETDRDEESENEFYNCSNKSKIKNKHKSKKTMQLPQIDLDMYSVTPTDDTQEDLAEVDFKINEDSDDEEDENDITCDLSDVSNVQPLWVLPLYSLLPCHKQAMVFKPPPDGCRLCVVSTNVAETSLTIPNVKYVIDSGRCKIRLYDKVTGVSTYMVGYTSKASANQRAGRAGRTAPGHCYRLYSSSVFNDEFEEFSPPEILRKPVDDLLLQMKVMNIDKVVNFPFPTPPGEEQLKTAERRLCILGALEEMPTAMERNLYHAKVTELGRNIAAFPVVPRYGKMLALSHQHNLIRYTICMVSALSIQEILIEAAVAEDETKKKWQQTRRFWAGTGNNLLLGDPMILVRAVGAAEFAARKGSLTKFCDEHGLREKAMIEIRKLRQQLTNEIILNIPGLELSIDPEMPPPTDTDAKLLRQILLSGTADQVAKKIPSDEINQENKNKWKYAYQTLEMEEVVFMQSSSVLRKTCPEWVVYQEVYETNKTYMRGITAIEPSWLPKFAPALCRLSEPLIEPPPRYNLETGKVMCHVNGTFGPRGWQLPIIEIEHPNNLEGVKLFARFILEGEVCPKLKHFVPSLLSTPSSINKPWAKLLPRVEAITKELLSKGVMSKDKLLEMWAFDKHFLLSAYKKWLPESAHASATLMWPPI